MQTPAIQKRAFNRVIRAHLKGNPDLRLILGEHFRKEHIIISQLLRPEPAIRALGGAVSADEIGKAVHRLKRLCRRGGRFLRRRRRTVGLHCVDALECVLRVFQIQLQLLHIQALAFQLNIRQGRVIAQERVPDTHRLTLADEDLRHILRVAGIDGLQILRGHGAVILHRVIKIAHQMILYRNDLDRVGLAAEIPQRTDQYRKRGHKADCGNDRDFYALFTHPAHLLPFCRPSVRRRGYSRCALRGRRSPARG